MEIRTVLGDRLRQLPTICIARFAETTTRSFTDVRDSL
jgi:hypothetical protein